MKKVVKKYIFALLICLVGALKVEAGPSLAFDGTNKIGANNSGDIDIVLNADGKTITAVEFNIAIDPIGYSVLTLNKSTSWGGDASVASKSILTGVNMNGVLATLNVLNNGMATQNITARLSLTNIKFTCDGTPCDDGQSKTKDITLTASSTTAKPQSSNAKLTGLTLNNGAVLSPAFNPNTKSYKINVKDTIRSLTIMPLCDSCTYDVDCTECTNFENKNKLELEYGKNVVTISTKSEIDGNNEVYTLTIYRGETADNSKFLEALAIDGFTFNEAFERNRIDYTATVPFESDMVNIIATPEDPAASIDIKGADNLVVGDNEITITVTSSETKDKKIYNITVTRLEEGEDIPEPTTPPDVPEEPKKNKWVLIIIIILVGAAIIGVAAYAIFGKKKTSKKSAAKTETNNAPEPDMTEEAPLLEELTDDSERMSTSVDDALADVMITREVIMRDEE